MLSGITKRYDHRAITTDQFRQEAAAALPPKSDDPKLEGFFAQWVYGTGIPALKLSYSVKGAAPAVKLTATLTQTGVDDDFSAWTPIEIRFARGPSIVKWISSSSDPVTFSIALKQAPSKVVLDPHNAMLKQ
jgi:aminopeptidase N